MKTNCFPSCANYGREGRGIYFPLGEVVYHCESSQLSQSLNSSRLQTQQFINRRELIKYCQVINILSFFTNIELYYITHQLNFDSYFRCENVQVVIWH